MAAQASPLWKRILDAVRVLRGTRVVADTTPGTVADAWTEDRAAQLGKGFMNEPDLAGGRELRILLLLCEGGRPTVPGSELSTKFGCGSPIDGARDLPKVAAWTTRSGLEFPVVASGGDADSPWYTLTWSTGVRRAFLDAVSSPESA